MTDATALNQAITSASFWIAAAALFYAYVGFPLMLILAARLMDRRVASADITPSLTLIIAAYNEEDCISQRLENALASDYPEESLEIIVASDGSTDRTNEIVGTFAARGVRLLPLPRKGKIFALTEAARVAEGEILVFSDANTVVAPAALRALARNFADPEVGGVAGHTGYTIAETTESAGRGESLYWQYDTMLKVFESRTGSIVSAHGGLYAVRRNLFAPASDPAVTDDFSISTGVVAQGARLVFERDARAWEVPVATSAGEFRRRVRLMTRGLRAVSSRRQLLNPRRFGMYALVLFSHKIVRRAVPVFLLTLLGTSALLSSGSFYKGLFLTQIILYSLALVGWVARSADIGRSKLLYVPFFFVMSNAAALVAMMRFLTGQRVTHWEPQRHDSLKGLHSRADRSVRSYDNRAAGHVDIMVGGLVHVRIRGGTNGWIRQLQRQLGRAGLPCHGQPDITISCVDELTRNDFRHVEVGRSGFTRLGFMIRAGAGWVQVPFAQAGMPCEFVCETSANSVPLLMPFIHLAAIQRGYLPLHASAFEWKGTGVVVTGWSRGGKTSALLAFGRHGAKYVGDDLVFIHNDGSHMRGVHAALSLSEWHIAQLKTARRSAPHGKRLLGAAVHRLAGALDTADAANRNGIVHSLRLRSVVRLAQRVTKIDYSVEELFHGSLEDARVPRKVFLMVSARQSHVSVGHMRVEDIAERMRFSLAAEAVSLMTHYSAYRFADAGPANPSIETMDGRLHELVHSSLRNMEGYLMLHPHPAPFDAMFAAMRPCCETAMPRTVEVLP
jgi:cellulose synthase/poly-beta-1,6-N-acetylglucosamine synthase-like glycosyltransferase